MANTYTLISSNVLSSAAATVTFSSIPSTYTDLVLRVSARSSASGALNLTINADSSSLYSTTNVFNSGGIATTTSYANQTRIRLLYLNSSSTAANTFTSAEFYIPFYTAAQNKPIAVMNAPEDNDTASNTNQASAGLYRSTTAITQLSLSPESTNNFVAGSSFYLYGIKNS
jgi:hypothetical protein